ncbi:MAG: TRAP transporter substrate-binding protein DctP [Leptospiraceae bacterium]|nr:TRAP transporter substrate-binding protein DctP [Leptospiraceae bacterium]
MFTLKKSLILALFVLTTQSIFSQVELKLGTVAPTGTPWADELNGIKKRVETESNKGIKMKIFLGGQLGGENEILQGIRKGRIQGGGLTAGAVASVIPEMDILESPYMFDSQKQADCILDNHLLEPFKTLFDEKGLIFVSWAENGYRNIGTKTKDVKSPADLKGLKIRSQESKIHLEFWKKIGASPVPIAIPEVLPSLQTGVVDGFDQTALMTLAAEWQTAIKFYTVTEHIYQPAVVVYSKDFFNKQTDENKKILMGTGNAMAPKARQAVRRLSAQLIKALEDNSVKINKLSDAEKGAFKALTSGVGEQMVAKIGGKASMIFGKIKEGKAACGK